MWIHEFLTRFWSPKWIEQVALSTENWALTRFIPVWVHYTLYKDVQGNVRWDLFIFMGIKLDWVWWARGVQLRALGTSFILWLCPQSYPQSISPGILKPAAKLTTTLLCCVLCVFLLILALLLGLLHLAGYLGTPVPNFPNNRIPWLPPVAPLLELDLNLTLSWIWSLVSSWREKHFFPPGSSSQNLKPANSSLLDVINCWDSLSFLLYFPFSSSCFSTFLPDFFLLFQP